MLKKMKLFAVAGVLTMAATTGSVASAATRIGDTVDCFRNGVACSGTSSATVGPGVEFTRGPDLYDFSGTGFSLFSPNSGAFGSPIAYSFRDQTSAFTSFSNLVLSGFSNFTSSRVSLLNGLLTIDVSGLDYSSNGPGTISFDLGAPAVTSAVPEPAIWLTLILGFGLIGGMLRLAARRPDWNFSDKIKHIAAGEPA